MCFYVRGSIWGYALFIYKGEMKMADTMGTKEAAERWGYPQATISKWCRQNKIPGAEQDRNGSPWHIPKDAVCPCTIRVGKGSEK